MRFPLCSCLDPLHNSLTIWGVLRWNQSFPDQKKYNFASKQILTDQFYCIATWWITGEFKHHKKCDGISFSLYCIFSQGKMCILEELQHEPSFSQEETEWTGLYWSLILQQENHIVDKLTAIRPYGDCSIKNLKFSCALNSVGYFITIFRLSFVCVFSFLMGIKKNFKEL